jgi:hypothetical protein
MYLDEAHVDRAAFHVVGIHDGGGGARHEDKGGAVED